MKIVRNILERAAQGNKMMLHGIGWYLLAMGETGSKRAKSVLARLTGWGILIWFVTAMLRELGALMWTASTTWFLLCLIAPSFLGKGAPEDEVSQEVGQDAETVDIVAALHEVGGGKSVHLSTVAAHLNLQLGDVHTLLKQERIPTRHSVKVSGEVAVGVHRDDLPPLPSPLAEEDDTQVAGSAAGQSATATATPIEVKRTERGTEVWVDNPLNPAETHIFRKPTKEAS